MEQQTKQKWGKILVGVAGLLVSMCLLALLGYRVARKKAPQDSSHGASSYTSEVQPTESANPFHLPTAIQTVVPEPEETPEPNNDYLVLAEETSVYLYILTENGDRVYAGDLPISLSALMPEDQQTLKDGIILDSDDELAALLEDYSS